MIILNLRTRFISALLLFCALTAHAQQVALKTNLLYDATTTPNLGVEYGFKHNHSVQLFYGLNPWSFGSGPSASKVKHWVLMPEYRWWTCSILNGWFIGVHAMGGEFNAANANLPIPGVFFKGDNLTTGVRDNRYEGAYLGAGFTAGYQWILSKHWNLELEAGVGYNHVWYKKYPCAECGTRLDKAGTNYVGLTKLGLSLMYIF